MWRPVSFSAYPGRTPFRQLAEAYDDKNRSDPDRNESKRPLEEEMISIRPRSIFLRLSLLPLFVLMFAVVSYAQKPSKPAASAPPAKAAPAPAAKPATAPKTGAATTPHTTTAGGAAHSTTGAATTARGGTTGTAAKPGTTGTAA